MQLLALPWAVTIVLASDWLINESLNNIQIRLSIYGQKYESDVAPLYVAHLSVTSLQASEHESRPIQVPSSQLIILEDRGGVPLDHYLSQKAKTEYGSLSGVAPCPDKTSLMNTFRWLPI